MHPPVTGKEATMAMPRYALQRPHVTEEESGRPSILTGSDVMAAWLGALLINAAVMIAIFFR
jgi:hypothetical protein